MYISCKMLLMRLGVEVATSDFLAVLPLPLCGNYLRTPTTQLTWLIAFHQFITETHLREKRQRQRHRES